MQEPCGRACHTASKKELPALLRVRSPGEAEAFQLSEQETLSKVVGAPLSGTSGGGLPTACRVQDGVVHRAA